MKTFDVYPINDITIVKAEGMTLWDDKNNTYTDMYGGHAVISIGHTAKRYVDYLQKQLQLIGFYSNSIKIPAQQLLAEKLTQLSGKTDYSLFMCNSGAEANENALKLASFHNGKKRVIAFTDAFHGRTSLAVSATDNPKIVAPVNQTDHIIFVPYNDSEKLKEVFQQEEVSSVIVEAIQGVGGVKVATPAFLSTIRTLCTAHNAAMIADCVQCGCGRTGDYFALDHSGVKADIYTMAKGIGNGFPIGALLIAPQFVAKYGMLGTTFGGNHLACQAALAVVDDMVEKRLMENAKIQGDYLIQALKAMDSDLIVEVRGRGLMIGVVLNQPAKPIRLKLLHEEHLFVGAAADCHLIRLLPSLTITRATCDLFLAAFKKVLQEWKN
ncbi:MAG: aminotransferase class III-fold pyridoxal phosphate-dependent enzyme [Bacteroidaceae bacterium]